MAEKAVVISIYWDSEDTLHSFFEGKGAEGKASGFKASLEDKAGVFHLVVLNDEAVKARLRRYGLEAKDAG